MSSFNSGRDAALSRRRALSAGKAALPPAQERVRAGFRVASLPGAPSASPALPQPAADSAASPPPPVQNGTRGEPALTGRAASILRRRSQAAGKSGLAALPEPDMLPPATEARPSPARPEAGTRVTSSRIGQGGQVTGCDRGASSSVSGTQHMDAKSAAVWRGCAKVGQARTENGLVVSGTLVRSAVRITGDERGDALTITGKADPRPTDDLTPRPESGVFAASQFQRQMNPHGARGANLGRSARNPGSRQRGEAVPVEATEKGAPITGSAVGRSLRVTGDLAGACRPVTGSQYLAPAHRATACGGAGGGTAPAEHIGAARPDPVTLSKVSVTATAGGQRVTGVDVEPHRTVTGDEPGMSAALTGSQYHAPSGDAATKSASARRMAARAGKVVTGDTPCAAQSVSGLGRGAALDITGTPYNGGAETAAAGDNAGLPGSALTLAPAQRYALLRAAPSAGEAQSNEGRITGSFAVGLGKVTGNLDFAGASRGGPQSAGAQARGGQAPAHARVSGEGKIGGRAITGDSWSEQSRVTGTEGAFAATRNPTRRGEQRAAFAGCGVFGSRAEKEPQDPAKQLVTGMSGSMSKSGARVTLSGGAAS